MRSPRLARKLAHGPSAAYGYIKQNINFAETATLPEVLVSEALANARASQTHDAKEAVQAFLEKRAPKFQGFWARALLYRFRRRIRKGLRWDREEASLCSG